MHFHIRGGTSFISAMQLGALGIGDAAGVMKLQQIHCSQLAFLLVLPALHSRQHHA
jgi:hypothetical protein